jgi:CheY-like chemotaxis protein
MEEPKQRQRSLNILVIEDEESIRRLLASILELEGHEVRTCGTALAGISAFRHRAADLVITDLGLPDQSGWEVARQIKAASSGTPVVLITGWGVTTAAAEARRRGVDYVLPKPFEFDELSAIVSRALADIGGQETAMDAKLKRAIRLSLRDGKLTCPAAWKVAEQVGVERFAVGEMADQLDIRVSHCQLGLFGYGEKRLGEHKIMKPAHDATPELGEAIRAAAKDGRITCAQLFEIAERLGKPAMTASAQAEALGIKIASCQLGCF